MTRIGGGSSCEYHQDDRGEEEQQQHLQVTLHLRIVAASLPRVGLIQSLPDTYAEVTTVTTRSTSLDSNAHPQQRFNGSNEDDDNDDDDDDDHDLEHSFSGCSPSQAMRIVKKGKTEM